MDFKVALIGFGNVGQGFAHILRQHGKNYQQRFGVNFSLVAVCDIQKGSVFNPQGLDIEALLKAAEKGDLQKVPVASTGWDALTTIRESNADGILELSYTDLNSGEPALSHIEAALQHGKHVATTNKGPISLHYERLAHLARQHNVELGIEGTVMSGTPALGLGLQFLQAAKIQRIQGILNGTTNYILTQMDSGASYEQALAEAQRLGYAEADPRGDVEGFDAAAKVVILANLLLEAKLSLKDVQRKGITQLSQTEITEAQRAGQRWKLIGSIEKNGEKVLASVQPIRLPLTHPLAHVSGATNAITYTTELLGDVTLIGPGAGRLETGYALVQDLLAIAAKIKQ